MRIYIAGPMTGYQDLNFPAFNAAAADLRTQGYHVENPAEINIDPTAEWLECMRLDIASLVTCDAVYMLPGWERSKGATIEHQLAKSLGLRVEYARSEVVPVEKIDQIAHSLAVIGVVGKIDGHEVVRRESVIDIVRRHRRPYL